MAHVTGLNEPSASGAPAWTLKDQPETVNRALGVLYPDARCELDYTSPFELLIATVLSAQTTDVRVNQVTPELFATYPLPADLAVADLEAVEAILRPLGFFRTKASAVVGLSQRLVSHDDGEVPASLAELITLPGVGRKTANVVLGNAFGVPGLTVDTHVGRLARRLGWTEQSDPIKVERELAALFPDSEWVMLCHRLIFHGRRVCFARKPACESCGIAALCPASPANSGTSAGAG